MVAAVSIAGVAATALLGDVEATRAGLSMVGGALAGSVGTGTAPAHSGDCRYRAPEITAARISTAATAGPQRRRWD